MRREKTSVSQEDYLKAIWEMLEEDHTPISARLAEELKVTPPAVTAALKRMTRDGHVRVERSGRDSLRVREGRAVSGISRGAAAAAFYDRRGAEARVRRDDDAAFEWEDHASWKTGDKPNLGSPSQLVEEVAK